VMFGGGMAGLAGGYMSLAYTPMWAENMTAGRGWIALALVVFASWRVSRVLLGAYLFGLASMGAPGTSGFPAEFLLILSALDTHTGAGLAALAGVVLGAAYFLGIYRRAFLGPTHNSTVADATDLRARELSVRAGCRETA